MMRSDRRQAVWNRTGGRCFYCDCGLIDDFATGRPDRRFDMQIDHMTPEKRGGSDVASNLVPACRACNSAKSSMTVDEYRLWLMLTQGRAPISFPGERRKDVERDWLLVSHLPAPPREPVKRQIPDRLARFLEKYQ
ncbi:HNH endonuclease [Mesorhizobium sp. B2-1-3A]|nr:HNH endonuclease [Mesorhizobium sp. B2-1-3A]